MKTLILNIIYQLQKFEHYQNLILIQTSDAFCDKKNICLSLKLSLFFLFFVNLIC